MDDYLTDQEKLDQIREWWRENRWFLIGGAAIAGLGYFGFGQFQAWKARTAEQAAAIYLSLVQYVEDDDRELADSALNQLAEEHPDSGYLDQARLLIASDNLIRDTDRSIAELQAIVDSSGNESMVKIARLRLARVLSYDEQYDRALAVLNIPDAGEFEARFSEIRGDIHADRGNVEAAISAYTDALLGAVNGTVDTQYVQMKLSDLIQSSTPETEAAVAGEEG